MNSAERRRTGSAPHLQSGSKRFPVRLIKHAGALFLLFTFLLAACGGGGNTSYTPPPAPPPPTPATDPDARADQLIAQMTQAEELQLVTGSGTPGNYVLSFPRGVGGYVPGISRLGIPDLYFADGSTGFCSNIYQATALPSSIASAAGWDTEAAYKYGTVIGSDTRAYGVNVNLGGNVNLIGREPRDGRTFETKGEDPVLAGKISAAHIRGIQDQHILGGTKHFALNDQETGRTTANVIVDERSARESDLLAFEIAIKDSKVQSVMCSYNLVNGAYSCENSHLLNDILKGEWGFPGFVMSDWWATHSSYQAAIAGLDQEQPDNAYFSALSSALQSGSLPKSRLDNMVHRILRAMLVSGLFAYPAVPGTPDVATNEGIAQQTEEQGAVLLKNASGQLPLNASQLTSIAVIGMHADIGVLSGGGSAQVTPTGGPALMEGYPNPPGWSRVIWDPSSPLKAIQAKAPNVSVQFNDGSTAAAAAKLAGASTVAIVFVSQWASEGMDLPSLNFTDVIHASPLDQDALVAAVVAANPHTIVVMENGGAQIMPWLNEVSAVLEAWYPGQKGAEAIANILFGSVNPSGKLPITFPASINDLPRPTISAGSTGTFNVDYTIDGYNVGYKWFDSRGLTPLFPFGFGLSYTTFAFSNAKLVNNLTASNPNIQVTFNLANTGSVAGAEVAQVYLGMPASTGEPPKRLIGWQRVPLNPGQSQTITIEADAGDSSHPFSYWDSTTGQWQMANGTYSVYLGDSSRMSDLTLVGTFTVGQ